MREMSWSGDDLAPIAEKVAESVEEITIVIPDDDEDDIRLYITAGDTVYELKVFSSEG